MKKSKYLILNSFYFDFNDELTEILKVKKSFKNQNMLDLFKFDKIKIIKENQFQFELLNFIYLPQNIKIIEESAFGDNEIKILDLSPYMSLKIIKKFSFEGNKIKELKLPQNIEIIEKISFASNTKIYSIDLSQCKNLKNINNAFKNIELNILKISPYIETINESAFSLNRIEILDLSQCEKLKTIDDNAFMSCDIKHLKLPKNIEEINISAFLDNEIKELDLSQCINLKYIGGASFEANKIKKLYLPQNIEAIYPEAFLGNEIEALDLSNCTNLKHIYRHAFTNNPLKEIKILSDVILEVLLSTNSDHYKDDIWNNFSYEYEHDRKAGTYKFEDGWWKWYPL